MRTRKYSDAELVEAVSTSLSIRQVLCKLGKSQQGGGSYRQIADDIKRLDLRTSHFLGRNYWLGKRSTWATKTSLSSILVENSSYTNRSFLKQRLYKDGIMKPQCAVCGLGNCWNGLPLVLVLDHVNGVNNDNRVENLRMLCPNCNSQQLTFAGRNRERAEVAERKTHRTQNAAGVIP